MADESRVRKTVDILAEEVRVGRARRRWSQEELAKRAGVHFAQVSSIENARLDSRLSTVDKVTGALGLTITFNDAA